MEEIWKDVEGFEGVYQISNLGQLKSFKKDKNGKILKNTNKNGDYFSVVLRNKDKIQSIRIHNLVAKHFILNPNNYNEINHKDGNKQNNCVNNLEWCTHKQNIEHAKKLGLWVYNHPYYERKVLQYDLEGNFIAEYKNSVYAYKKTGVCARNILQVASKAPFNKNGNYRKQAGGFIWRFA